MKPISLLAMATASTLVLGSASPAAAVKWISGPDKARAYITPVKPQHITDMTTIQRSNQKVKVPRDPNFRKQGIGNSFRWPDAHWKWIGATALFSFATFGNGLAAGDAAGRGDDLA